MITKQTPFHEVGLEKGAAMSELFGYYLPWYYSPGHEREHLATREAVSVCDLHYMAEFVISGPDASRFVQHVATADISKKRPGSVKYSCFCNENGLMIDDGTVWCITPTQYMLITGDESDLSWFQSVSSGFDVSIDNVTDTHTTLAIQGPNSRLVVKAITDAPIESIKYYNFIDASVGDTPCHIARMGYTGEYGYELHFASGEASRIWNKLFEAGREHGIVPLGQAGLESLRQEAGYILVGNDHDKNTNPLEAGQGWTVDFDKPDFIGKNALEAVRREGLRRTLVWFDLPDGSVASKGDPIFAEDRQIGTVTSGSYSPGRKRGTAMGYVRPEFAINGVPYSIQIGEVPRKAVLNTTPLYDPGNVRSRSYFR